MKKVGTCLYVHKSAFNQIEEYLKKRDLKEEIIRIKNVLENHLDFNYEILKYDIKTKNISMIQSNDWKTSFEPLVGDSLCVHFDGKEKLIKSSGKIYHGKHFFINKDYDGFSYEDAKRRYEEWNLKIPNIKEHKSKIGTKKYWIELLQKYGLEI